MNCGGRQGIAQMDDWRERKNMKLNDAVKNAMFGLVVGDALGVSV